VTRNEKLSASRAIAREMIQDSSIVDATAQFIALMIEEVHKSKVAPLQASIKELEAQLAKATEVVEASGRDRGELEAKLAKAVEALEQCQTDLDQYSAHEYPGDHPVQARYRKRDYDANPARIAIAAIKGEAE